MKGNYKDVFITKSKTPTKDKNFSLFRRVYNVIFNIIIGKSAS